MNDNHTDPVRVRVSIVVAALDAGDMLIDCLDRIGADRPGVELVIVDNASTDGCVERAADRFSSAHVIRNKTNRGYAPAYNQGATAATGPFVLLLNSDAFMGAEDLDKIVDAAAADPSAAFWQPVTMALDGSLESTGDVFTWWGINRHLHEVPPGPVATIFATVGAALLVRRDAFAAVGGFNESYFAYYEESDLCWRMRLRGWEGRVVTTARVEHVGGATTGRVLRPDEVRYLAFRNRLRTTLANPSAASLVRIVPLHLIACVGFLVLYTVTGRLRSARAVASALVWPIGNRDVLAEQRRSVQSTRTVSDRGLLHRPDIVTPFGTRAIFRHLRRMYWFERAGERRDALPDRDVKAD